LKSTVTVLPVTAVVSPFAPIADGETILGDGSIATPWEVNTRAILEDADTCGGLYAGANSVSQVLPLVRTAAGEMGVKAPSKRSMVVQGGFNGSVSSGVGAVPTGAVYTTTPVTSVVANTNCEPVTLLVGVYTVSSVSTGLNNSYINMRAFTYFDNGSGTLAPFDNSEHAANMTIFVSSASTDTFSNTRYAVVTVPANTTVTLRANLVQTVISGVPSNGSYTGYVHLGIVGGVI